MAALLSISLIKEYKLEGRGSKAQYIPVYKNILHVKFVLIKNPGRVFIGSVYSCIPTQYTLVYYIISSR